MNTIALLLTILASAPGSPPSTGTPGPPQSETTVAPEASSGCALETLAAAHRNGQPDAALAADCTACHDSEHSGSVSHRVGMDYAQTASAKRGRLKAAAEVSQRGISLPGGKVGCVSCHHPRSTWAKHIVLPHGATARAAVDVARPEASETDGEVSQPGPGSRISTKPLCQACHVY